MWSSTEVKNHHTYYNGTSGRNPLVSDKLKPRDKLYSLYLCQDRYIFALWFACLLAELLKRSGINDHKILEEAELGTRKSKIFEWSKSWHVIGDV